MPLILGVLAFLNFYSVVNLGRLAKHRLKAQYLIHAFWSTTFWLAIFQLAAVLLAAVDMLGHLDSLANFYWLAALQLATAAIMISSVSRKLGAGRLPAPTQNYPESSLPTLTVCIPARNETKELQDCLQGLVASDYPKLEILVLDDCSQNVRTPEIIRTFAHDGVRFIAGQEPPERWVAKNYAYSRLASQASGEVLLFCGVDTRFGTQSLSILVKSLLEQRREMLCVIPKNIWSGEAGLTACLIQPGRYSWEILLPRTNRRPPVLSTCWLITSKLLKRSGGFEAVSRKAVPESYLARQAARDNHYLFVTDGHQMGLSSEKTFEEQLSTAIRVRYPQLHRRPELVALVTAVELGILVCPLPLAVAAALNGLWLMAGLAATAYVLSGIAYARVINLTYRRTVWYGWLILPLAALFDIYLLNSSMWRYEFGEVIWKGRNVCLPVMQVTPQLPKTG